MLESAFRKGWKGTEVNALTNYEEAKTHTEKTWKEKMILALVTIEDPITIPWFDCQGNEGEARRSLGEIQKGCGISGVGSCGHGEDTTEGLFSSDLVLLFLLPVLSPPPMSFYNAQSKRHLPQVLWWHLGLPGS